MEGTQVDFSFLDFNEDDVDGFHDFGEAIDFSESQNISAVDLEGALKNLSFNDLDVNQQPEPADLPEWACVYCGIHTADSVVKCLTSGKWFCNGKSTGSASCIVTHLVKAKCKEVGLHKHSPLGETVLECYNSGNRNVFALGYVPLKDENTVVLLARDTPSSAAAIKDLNLDMTQWEPLIADRCFADWLVKHPTPAELQRARHINLEQVSKLEDVWRNNPTATIDDLDAAEGIEEEPLPVALHYEDAYQYQTVFGPLIKLEADYDRITKESQSKENVTVHWSIGLSRRHIARFYIAKDSTDLKIMIGDELRLRHPCPRVGSGPWQGVGLVVRLDDASEEVAVEMRGPEGSKSGGKGGGGQQQEKYSAPPTDVITGFSVEYVWRGTTYERMERAVKSFAVDETSVTGYIYHRILGHELPEQLLKVTLPKKLSAPGLPELNHSQAQAVQKVLQQPLSLIQGPPGTGKTVTSATIVYHLAKLGQGQVLVAAPSNIAVDHLAERLALTGLRVVRLQAKSREEVATSIEHLTLAYQVRHLEVPQAAEVRKLQLLREELGELSAADERKLRSLMKVLEKEVVSAADVVCTTCAGAGDPRLTNFRFRRVLIDEATQAVEPECLIPMALGAKQIILVGDHCQLGPVVLNKKAAAAGLCQSLFERLMLLGVRPIRLAVQYRMHPILSEFPSNTFYEGALQNGVSAAERSSKGLSFPWPAPAHPFMFLVQLGAEEISASGTSYLNRTEATQVEKLVTTFLKQGVNPDSIGIITPYEGQRAYVVSTMTKNGPLRQQLYSEIEVASVDSFQGREKDYIILSCVRSNDHQGIGFLSDARRLNVALTRARLGLVVLGNPRALAQNPIWNGLLHHFREAEALVEGPLTNLKASMVQLPRPRTAFDGATFGLGGRFTTRFRPVEKAGERMDTAGGNIGSGAGNGYGSHHGHHGNGYMDYDGMGEFTRQLPLVADPFAIPNSLGGGGQRGRMSSSSRRQGGGGGGSMSSQGWDVATQGGMSTQDYATQSGTQDTVLAQGTSQTMLPY